MRSHPSQDIKNIPEVEYNSFTSKPHTAHRVSELSRVFCPSASRRGVRTPHSGEHHRETRNLLGGAASRVEELQLGIFFIGKIATKQLAAILSQVISSTTRDKAPKMPLPQLLVGKVAAITGGLTGIGRVRPKYRHTRLCNYCNRNTG